MMASALPAHIIEAMYAEPARWKATYRGGPGDLLEKRIRALLVPTTAASMLRYLRDCDNDNVLYFPVSEYSKYYPSEDLRRDCIRSNGLAIFQFVAH
jgi:hypothetical protein